MPYKHTAGLDIHDHGSTPGTSHLAHTAEKDKREDLRSELVGYGVDPEMLDDSAIELYAAFRIPPGDGEKGHSPTVNAQRGGCANVSGLKRILSLPTLLLPKVNALRTRVCPPGGNRTLCLLVIMSAVGSLTALMGTVLSQHLPGVLRGIGGTFVRVDSWFKGVIAL